MMKIIAKLTPKKSTKKSLSPSSKKALNIEKKFKNYIKRGYSINQARYWSRL